MTHKQAIEELRKAIEIVDKVWDGVYDEDHENEDMFKATYFLTQAKTRMGKAIEVLNK